MKVLVRWKILNFFFLWLENSFLLQFRLFDSLVFQIISLHITDLLIKNEFEPLMSPFNVVFSCHSSHEFILYLLVQISFMHNLLKHSLRGYNIVSHREEHLNKSNKYLIYSIYVWGGAAIISLGTFLMDNTDILSANYKPRFGVKSCWLQGKYTYLGPIS